MTVYFKRLLCKERMVDAAFLKTAEAVAQLAMSIFTGCGGGTYLFIFPASAKKIIACGDAPFERAFTAENLLPHLAMRYFAPRMRHLRNPMPPAGCSVDIDLDTHGFYLTPLGKATPDAEKRSWRNRLPTLDKKLNDLKAFGLPFIFRFGVGHGGGREMAFPLAQLPEEAAAVNELLGCDWAHLVRENTDMPSLNAVMRDAARAAAREAVAVAPPVRRRRSGPTTSDPPWRQRGVQAEANVLVDMQRNGGLAHYVRSITNKTSFFDPVLVQYRSSRTFTVVMANFKLNAKQEMFVSKEPVQVRKAFLARAGAESILFFCFHFGLGFFF